MHEHTSRRFRTVPGKKDPGRVILFPSPSQEPYKIPAASFVPAPLFSKEIFERAFLALQNHLQALSRELELLRATPAVPSEAYGKVIQEIEQADNVLQELREYVAPPELRLSTENLANMVEYIRESGEYGGVHRPRTRSDLGAGGTADAGGLPCPFGRVATGLETNWQGTETSGGLCLCAPPRPRGRSHHRSRTTKSRSAAASGPQDSQLQHLDLKIRSCGVIPLVIEADALFRPFTWAKGYQLGLSLVLAQRTVSRQHGQIFFQQISPQQSCFTLLFRA